MERESISGLEAKKLARLVGLTLNDGHDERPDKDTAIKELMEDCLAAAPDIDDGRRKGLPQVIGRLLGPRRLGACRSLRSVLLDSGSTVGAIKNIRRSAKDKAARTDDKAEHTVMTTIYFAAIANRLAFHGQRITTYSYESLVSSFGKLRGKSWMPPELAELFEKAEKVCQGKVQEGRSEQRR